VLTSHFIYLYVYIYNIYIYINILYIYDHGSIQPAAPSLESPPNFWTAWTVLLSFLDTVTSIPHLSCGNGKLWFSIWNHHFFAGNVDTNHSSYQSITVSSVHQGVGAPVSSSQAPEVVAHRLQVRSTAGAEPKRWNVFWSPRVEEHNDRTRKI